MNFPYHLSQEFEALNLLSWFYLQLLESVEFTLCVDNNTRKTATP